MLYRHPEMLDVDMEVLKQFHFQEHIKNGVLHHKGKNHWSLKVKWWLRDKILPSGKVRKGGYLATQRLKITNVKFKEFKPIKDLG